MYSSSEYSFICLMFSLVRIMLLYGCSFLGFFRLSINYRGVVSGSVTKQTIAKEAISRHLLSPPS